MIGLSTIKVRRNGLTFQVPARLSSYRYTVHPTGSGSGWDESLDVDQPHGLDYRSNQDLRKGIRKRAEHEHSVFADNTVGMQHLAGGCRILGIVENTTDLSTGFGDASIDITGGKFQGRGLIYDQSNNALWCATGDGTVSDDPYLVKIHPDRGWDGGDVTWAGGHEFDASVDISGNVGLDGDFTVDGTCVFDATGIQFGGTAGIGLFYDPTAYSGGESSIMPDGRIVKMGVFTPASNPDDLSFATAFPNNLVGLSIIAEHSTLPSYYLTASGVTGFTGIGAAAKPTKVHWIAIGY